MTNGEPNVHPAGRVHGSGAADDSGANGDVEKENGSTQETLEKICPYCRRPWPAEEADTPRTVDAFIEENGGPSG